VDGAADAREALTMLQVASESGHPFKGVVIDYKLGANGFIELAGKIWELYGTQSIH